MVNDFLKLIQTDQQVRIGFASRIKGFDDLAHRFPRLLQLLQPIHLRENLGRVDALIDAGQGDGQQALEWGLEVADFQWPETRMRPSKEVPQDAQYKP